MSDRSCGLQVIRTTCTNRVEGKTLCGRKLRMVWLRGRWHTTHNTLHHPSCPNAVSKQKDSVERIGDDRTEAAKQGGQST
jgi:hypothetical protein